MVLQRLQTASDTPLCSLRSCLSCFIHRYGWSSPRRGQSLSSSGTGAQATCSMSCCHNGPNAIYR